MAKKEVKAHKVILGTIEGYVSVIESELKEFDECTEKSRNKTNRLRLIRKKIKEINNLINGLKEQYK